MSVNFSSRDIAVGCLSIVFILSERVAVQGSPVNISGDSVISLERSECYGTCPAYRVEIRSDGLVLFDGYKFVRQNGHHERRITQASVQKLVTAFEQSKFVSMQNRYPADIADGSTVSCSFLARGRVKRISHQAPELERSGISCVWDSDSKPPVGCADRLVLRHLEDLIDEVAQTSEWIGAAQK